jgi:hypothetical protein
VVAEAPSETKLAILRSGVDLPEGKTAPARVTVMEKLPKILQPAPGFTRGVWLEIVLREGKKRQIRHMTAAIGHPTLRLIRWSIGPLELGDLAPGAAAPLTRREISSLRTWVQKDEGKRQAAAEAAARPAVKRQVKRREGWARPAASRRTAPKRPGRGAGSAKP